MKKRKTLPLVVFVACLVGVTGLQAQTLYGVKAGINIATLKFEVPGQGAQTKFGWQAGAFAKIALRQKFFLQPELDYSIKGYAYSLGIDYSNTINLNYAVMPMLLGYRATPQLAFLLGPEVGYLLKASAHSGSQRYDISEKVQSFDAGIDLGAAYIIKKGIGVEARYNYGFKGIFKGYFTDTNGNPVARKLASNRVAEIGFLYLLKK